MAVANAVGAPHQRAGDSLTDLCDHLATHSSLLLLDGCEHVRAACARLAVAVLSAAPEVSILTTSREPLGVRLERVHRLEPLRLPAEGANAAEVVASPAGELLVARATAASEHFRIDGASAADVVALCRELDGLPLALEIAAVHLAAASPREVLEGVRHGVTLQDRDPSRPDRQHGLDALLAWSERLLSDDERRLFRRLSLCRGGFTLDAALVVGGLGDLSPESVPELVWSLVAESLVGASPADGETRYRMLETVRTAAFRRLKASGEVPVVAAALAGWLLADAPPERCHAREWASRLDTELDNARSSLGALDVAHREQAQLLACSVGLLHDYHHTYRAGIEELERYAAQLPGDGPARVALLSIQCDLYLRIGDLDAAARALADAEAALDAAGGGPAWDVHCVARSAGGLAARQGDVARAAAIAADALARPGPPRSRARMANLLGIATASSGDLDRASAAFHTELAGWRELGIDANVAAAHGNIAEIELRRESLADAAFHQRASLELGLELGAPAFVAYSLLAAARLAAACGRWAPAVRLQAGGEQLLQRTGVALFDDDRALADELVEQATEVLGPAASDAADAGRADALDDLVAAAREELMRSAAAANPPP